ncbi:hypothetical protein EYF80_034865 [Liparis tanakae]|uniref:Uncharacterized protein n=1 Tax=Liparis tanakae TaxID=230148 RepID=A0A4Z2GNX3_9TELE|nr:hypothetical protein EYF80_034865 [Liparis tanakae]
MRRAGFGPAGLRSVFICLQTVERLCRVKRLRNNNCTVNRCSSDCLWNCSQQRPEDKNPNESPCREDSDTPEGREDATPPPSGPRRLFPPLKRRHAAPPRQVGT